MTRVSIGVVFVILVLGWPLMPASAEDSVALESRTSVCVNPASPPRTAHSVEEQKAARECLEWSQFAAAISIVERDEFKQCQGGTQMSDKSLPLRQFLDQVLYAYHHKQPSEKPVTETILKSPAKFGLRLLRAGESRFGSLMVWPGSAGLVVDDRNEPNAAVSLQKLVLLYPSTAKCGKLEVIAADKLVPQATVPAIRYFQPVHPRLFWNAWIEDANGHEQPANLQQGTVYRLRLAFSALDFKAQKDGNDEGRAKIAQEQVEDYLPNFEPYFITVVPVGNSGSKTQSSLVTIDREVLARTLALDTITANTYNDLSRDHNALRVQDGADVLSRHSPSFIPAEPGCISFVVIVSSQSTRRLVTSWRVNTRVGDQDATPCAANPVSRRVGPSAVPWFELADEKQAVARLSFLDFGNVAIGSFQKSRDADHDPVSWVLRVPLARALRDLSDYVNGRIGSEELDLTVVSSELTKTLFDCDGDDQCDGNIALQELRALARTSPKGRVQVNVRNVVTNTNYYVPIQLAAYSEREVLGQYLEFVQPLPIPLPPVPAATKCVSDWTSGLIVTDAAFSDNWRSTLVPTVIEPLHHRRFKALDNLKDLKSYFMSTKREHECERPEALVLLAHHGRGFLADTQQRGPFEGIPAYQVSRKFKNGSVGILMACSIGAIGDKDNDGAEFLGKMNEKYMRAAIISPVNVPGRLATRFLENMKFVAWNMQTDTTLSEILRRARERLLNGPDPEDDNESIRIAANFLMVVGDPDALICGVIK